MKDFIINNVKTGAFMALLMGLFLGAGYLIGGPSAVLPALILGGLMNAAAYFFSDKIALATVGAKKIGRKQDPELYDIVKELTEKAKMPMPVLAISPVQAPNAFATGRNPRNSVICVTQGLRSMLNDEELKGVIAHELSHVKHRDILISTIAAIVAAGISYMAYLGLFFGGDEDSNPFGALLLLIFGPMAAGLIRMAISRSREFEADREGAALAGSARGLANSLRKLEAGNKRMRMRVPEAQTSLFIVKPFTGKKMAKLFMTHPPTEERIKRLEEMKI